MQANLSKNDTVQDFNILGFAARFPSGWFSCVGDITQTFLKMVSALAAWHPHTTIITAKCTQGRFKMPAAQTGELL